ncbi:hypothetical protein IFO70_22155 [Phormidium tenue FACHB-886]|nr:hypothetical protein [Phormidium tenue FACHB-886]
MKYAIAFIVAFTVLVPIWKTVTTDRGGSAIEVADQVEQQLDQADGQKPWETAECQEAELRHQEAFSLAMEKQEELIAATGTVFSPSKAMSEANEALAQVGQICYGEAL